MKNKKVLIIYFLTILTTVFTIYNLTHIRKSHVFIDLGANNGDSIKYFIDKNYNYNENEYLKGYGAKNNFKWKIYAVEANPFFNTTLTQVEKHYKLLGHKFYYYMECAAWIKNEKLKFYLDTVNPSVNYWGSSLLENHPDVIKSNRTQVVVNGIDVADILRRYISNDEIVLKIDIEGTEYQLLIHLIETNTLKLVDIITVEFHNNLVSDQNLLISRFKTYFIENNIKFIAWF